MIARGLIVSLILGALLPLTVQAGFYSCGEDGISSDAGLRAHGFLASLQGRYELGDCQIELQMCDATAPVENGSIVGDMAVTDKYGQSFYVPFDFSRVATEKVKTVIKNGRRMVHYEFIERLPDENSGRTEAYRMEILKSEDLSEVVSLELGVYTTRLKEQYPNLPAKKSYWVICKANKK